MDAKIKKRLIIGISLTTILGVAGYFAWQRWGKKPEEDNDDGVVIDDSKKETQQDPISDTSRTPSSSSSKTNRPDDILDFQKYANEKGYTPKLKEDGLWGPKTSKGWKKWGESYKTSENSRKDSQGFSGQMASIWKAAKNHSRKVITNSKGIKMIKAIGKTSGNSYYWSVPGSFYSYSPKTKKWLSSGNYANNGKTIIVTGGNNTGKTIKGRDIMNAAYKAATNPQHKQTLSTSQVNSIATKMYSALSSGGYSTNSNFTKEWNKLKTAADWTAVYHKFGTMDGKNLWNWMKDASWMTPNSKSYYNKWFKDRGSKNKF